MLLPISNPRYVTIQYGHLQFGMFMDALITIGVVWDVHGCPNHCRSIFSFTIVRVLQFFHTESLISAIHISVALR